MWCDGAMDRWTLADATAIGSVNHWESGKVWQFLVGKIIADFSWRFRGHLISFAHREERIDPPSAKGIVPRTIQHTPGWLPSAEGVGYGTR